MDMQDFKGNYRDFIISRWVDANIAGFRPPSQVDFENQSKYYMPLVEKLFPIRKDIRILEIGCGYGGLIYTLKKLGFYDIDAIDIIPACCEFVKRNFGINVKCIDMFDFFKENNKKYDLILAFDVVEHFNKDEIITLLLSIFNSLKGNGIFIMKVPNGGSLSGIYIRYSGFTHELAFTPLSIEELFKCIGFKRVYCIPEPQFSSNMIKKFGRKIIMKFFARLFSLDPNFLGSKCIIGVGFK